MPAPRSFRLVLEYDGRSFEGWQLQAGSRPNRTVQGVLGEALESITGGSARIRGAGRTDAGVHAFGQVASIVAQTQLDPQVLARALNARLPADVAVVACDEVPAGWDALREARAKHYRYQIWNGSRRSPLRHGRWTWIREPLDLAAMRRAGEIFVGTHDFASLCAAGSDVKTTVRTLRVVTLEGVAGGELTLDVVGEGFLRHMVRNLAGTLIEIGKGRWPVVRAAEILASRDRGQAGPTAPAEGLVLVRVWDGWSGSADARDASQADSATRSRADLCAIRSGSSVDLDEPVG